MNKCRVHIASESSHVMSAKRLECLRWQWRKNTCWTVCVFVAQSCLTLCGPMDCSLPASSVHGILQARILEWVAIPFSRESSLPRDWTLVSHMTGRFFTVWVAREQTCAQIPVPFPTRHMHLGKSWTSSCFWLLICKESVSQWMV